MYSGEIAVCIFLSFKFYVKSTLENLEASEINDLVKSSLQKEQKIH